MKSSTIHFLILNAILTGLTLISSSALAQTLDDERWFEVEVILFNQLGDKTLLNESFPPGDELRELPAYPKVVDLFTPYLYPEIASLKQLLPSCDNILSPEALAEQSNKLPRLFTLKNLKELAHIPLSEDERASRSSSDIFLTQDYNQQLNSVPEFGDVIADDDSVFIAKLTPKQRRLIKAAEKQFAPIKFNTFNVLPSLSSKALCKIDEINFAEIKEQDTRFSYNEIAISKVPPTINNPNSIDIDQPHLIGQDSLQLTDIVKTISRSPNFRPLLHFGWRLAPQTKTKAEAYNVFAGNNYEIAYQEKLAQYKKKQLTKSAIEQNAANLETPNSPEQLSENEIITAEINHKISEIITQAEAISSDEKERINDLLDNPQPVTLLPVAIDNSDSTHRLNAPMAPLQTWFLEGVFRVHLDHYLYITADFNLIDTTLEQYNNHNNQVMTSVNKTDEPKLIPFQQNRRVISGEIHYFDHPYMGMIVQIRKHQRPVIEKPTF